MNLTEELVLIERFYPSSSKCVNSILHSLISNAENKIRIEGPKSGYYLSSFTPFKDQETLSSLILWIEHVIINEIVNIPLTCPEVWGCIYNQGDYINTHTHKQGDMIDCSTPNYFSFVYYVTTPEGSSPLVFPTSGHEVKAEEGKVVIFESRLRHTIPPNQCEERCIVAGNFVSSTPGVLNS